MRFPILRFRELFRRETLRDDATAGIVLGVESVPDGLAGGLLAGVNPVAGLYAYLFGTVGGALFTSSSFMAVQATGAMAIIISDVDLGSFDDPERALFTLSVLTGALMILAGLLQLGSVLRFVSSSVMTGFIAAIGVNIVLGQLDTFTGYDADGSGRIARAIDLLFHLGMVDLPSVVVGIVTVGLIVVLQRTPLGALGLVVAVIAGSALAAAYRWFDVDVQILDELTAVPSGLPTPTLPALGDVVGLAVPAISLMFVGLVQGAGVTAGFPNADGSFPDGSQDFVGQGAGNVLSGMFQGMPVGGSMSGSSLLVSGGARTRLSLLVAGAVMAVIVVAFAPLVGHVAMPALAGLLIVVGVGTVRPAKILSIARTGPVQMTVMSTTLVLTMVVPLQFAVLCGVALSIILFVAQQASRLVTRRIVFEADGRRRETDPPATVPTGDVIVLQPYGSIFFAAAPVLEAQLPTATSSSTNSVVILRIRGADDAGATFVEVLRRYATALRAVGSKLVLVTDNERIPHQLRLTGAIEAIGEENIYVGTEWVGETVRRAHRDAREWVRRSGSPAGRRSPDEEAEDDRGG